MRIDFDMMDVLMCSCDTTNKDSTLRTVYSYVVVSLKNLKHQALLSKALTKDRASTDRNKEEEEHPHIEK